MFWRLFCSQETKTTWFRTAQYLKNSHVKGLLSNIFFNVLTKHCASFLNFFVSSMVIMSHLLSLLNKKWTPKPSSTLFMGNRFPFSSKLILASCLAVLHFLTLLVLQLIVEDFWWLISGPHTWMGPLAFHTDTFSSMVQQWSI